MRHLIVLAMLLGAGCAGPWTVIRSSSPPALRGASQLSVYIDSSELEVDGMSREELEASLSSAELHELDSAWRSALANFTSELSSEMSVPITIMHSAPAGDELRMIIRFLRLQRGARGTIGPATSIDMRIEVYEGGEMVDAIELGESSSASRARPNIPRRLRLVAVGLGTLAAQYFETEQTR